MKDGFKQTEIGEIPVDWEVVKLGEVLTIETGKRNAQDAVEDGEFPFFTRAVNIPRIDTYSYDTEALFIAGEGNFKLKYYVGKFDVHQRTYVLTSSGKQPINLQFFKEVIDSKLEKLVSTSVGSTVQSLRKPIIAELTVPLPPLPEQQKIAEILSTLDEKMTVIDSQLAQTQELKKGLMQHLLTKGIGHTAFKDSPLGEIPASWEGLTFNDLVKFSGGAQPPRSTFVFEPQEGYIRLVQTRDYRTDKYKTYIPVSLTRKKCTKSDIMIGRYGPPIFQILRGIEGAYNVALIKAIPNEVKVLREYLFYYISQYEVWAFVENLSQRGGGQTGVDLDELKKYPFPLPPFAEQEQIIEILTTLDDKLQVLTDKKTQYQELKRGLMQQLLTGQRRVRLPHLAPALA